MIRKNTAVASNYRPICVFSGSASATNVKLVLSHWAMMAPDCLDLHLITTSHQMPPDQVQDRYQIFGQEHPATLRGSVEALLAYLSSHSPSAVVQITKPPVHGTVAGLLAKRHSTPFVYRYSGDRFYQYSVKQGLDRITTFGLGNIIGRVPLVLASYSIVLGPTGRERLTARGFSDEHIITIPPTVNPQRFEEHDHKELSVFKNDTPTALFVGRLSRLKGLETLERTLPRILDYRKDLQIVCVGRNQDAIAIPEYYRDRVKVVGRVSPSAIPKYMKDADVYLHPSLTEGIPRVILEALAARTPVIARNVGDIATVTENTFVSDEKFVDLVCKFESLSVDPIEPYSIDSVRPRFKNFLFSLNESTFEP